MWGALSEERTGLPFTISSGPRQQALCTDPTEKVCIFDDVTALHSIVRYAEMCLPSRCLETDCITPFYYGAHASRGVYRAVAWQCIDQTRYNMILYIYIIHTKFISIH
jgi:hypothetical protein